MAKRKTEAKPPEDNRTPFQRFEQFARKIVRVPKSAIRDKRKS
jgi:hypothetical protein